MIHAAVLGSPISHSLSPLLHNKAYSLLGIGGEYVACEVKERELHNFLITNSERFSAYSLTMPLKEEGLKECVELSADATLLNAVNTLTSGFSGFKGDNTDVLGFEYLLKNINVDEVTILGGGGTAKAALLASRRHGFKSQIFRRSSKRDRELIQIDPTVTIRDWDQFDFSKGIEVLINATPTGAISPNGVVGASIVIESLYHPWPSTLLSMTPTGKTKFTGLHLLAAQASYQIELMARVKVSHEDLIPELTNFALSHINSN
ncbi:MAG: hypothetical protein EB054_01155 [Actinobacteria bacterium]|nr:hypothetical protein [Actinomycetota bacterium]